MSNLANLCSEENGNGEPWLCCGVKKGRMEGWREGGTRMTEKECICAHASTYQLISSEFLSGLKHGPKVDCGKQKTNKSVRTSGKEPERRW